MGKNLKSLIKTAPSFGDERRMLWPDPEDITGIKGYRQHGSIFVGEKNKGYLGNHYHPYPQFTHVLLGEVLFRMINLGDLDDRASFLLRQGQFLEVPANFAHVAVPSGQLIFQDFGPGKFDQENIVPCDKEIIKLLAQEDYFIGRHYQI
jgi:hypothetical protein